MQNTNIKNEIERNDQGEAVVTNVFDEWNKLKQEIDNRQTFSNFRSREIWWCSVGKNIGTEEDGKNISFERPVLVLKKWSSQFFVGLPLTTKKQIEEKSAKYYFKYNLNDLKDGYIMLSQVRVFSSKRLIRRIKKVGTDDFKIIHLAAQNLLFDNTLPDKVETALSSGSPVPNGNL